MKRKLLLLGLCTVLSLSIVSQAEEPHEALSSTLSIRVLEDGSYEPSVKCISALCSAVSCTLNVTEGEMSADLILDCDQLEKLYPGTGTEAATAEESACIKAEVIGQTTQVQIPVTLLDEAMHFALYVPAEDQWYEALITLSSENLPEDAFTLQTPVTPDMLSLSDGRYTADAALKGGSGRAGILSPCELIVEDGTLLARIIFSSSNYDYVLRNEIRYEPQTLEGGSTFLLPVEGFDFDLPLTADTTAMSQPHEIDYTVRFDSASLKEVIE